MTETKVRAPLEVKHFKNQVFENLKINHSRQNLFKDDLFPPEIKSLHYSKNPPEYFIKHNIVWKRASVSLNSLAQTNSCIHIAFGTYLTRKW